MEYYELTSEGRKAIPVLKGRLSEEAEDAVAVLEYLKKGAATIEDLATGIPMDESGLYLTLVELTRERWVRRRRTKSLMY